MAHKTMLLEGVSSNASFLSDDLDQEGLVNNDTVNYNVVDYDVASASL